MKVTGVYLYSPVTGSRPALFHRYFFAHSLLTMFSYFPTYPELHCATYASFCGDVGGGGGRGSQMGSWSTLYRCPALSDPGGGVGPLKCPLEEMEGTRGKG